jgi:NADPH:quinone reductase
MSANDRFDCLVLPHDSYSREFGLFVGEKLPWVPAINIAGEVVKAGGEVKSAKVGDHVFGLGNNMSPTPDQGGLQQFALLDGTSLAVVPGGFTDDQVVTLPVNVVTSFMALFTQFGFGFPAPWTDEAKTFDYTSQTIVILAAGSNVGKLAVQLAKIAGIGCIVCVAGLGNEEELKRYGATHVIDRHLSHAEIIAKIHAITGDDSATKVYDCYSWEFSFALEILPKDKPAQLATLHRIKEPDLEKLNTEWPNVKAGIVRCSNANLAPYVDSFWGQVVRYLRDGKLAPTNFQVIEGFDVAAINDALDVYAAAKPQPQVIVHPPKSSS